MAHSWFPGRRSIVPVLIALALVFVLGCGGSAAEPQIVEKEVIKDALAEVSKGIPVETVREGTVIAAPTPIAGQVPGLVVTTKVDRVIYAFGELNETNRAWTVARPSYYQFDPWAETLVGLDPKTNARIPRLADRWEASPDGKSWTFFLHKGVPFHFGWGEFTSADVLNTQERTIATGSLSAASYFKEAKRIEVAGPHEVTFHMSFPAVDMPAMMSRGFGGGQQLMYSDAQIKKEGYEGIDRKPAGTGSYQYGGRKIGENIWFERAPGEHWRGERPDFSELEIKWVREDVSRLAMLLTGEAHIASLSRDLQLEAVKRGMRTAEAGVATNDLALYFGGMFFREGDPNFDPTLPWVDPKVRRAMNMAINRQEMLDFVLRGQGELLLNTGFHPILRGWNPQWEKDWEKLYGYNPEKAVELLTDAGYGPDNPFEFTIWNYISSDEPETPVMVEALINYWEPVGLKVTLKDTEWGTVRKYYRKRGSEIKEGGHGNVMTMRSTATQLRRWAGKNSLFYQTDLIWDNYQKYLNLDNIDDKVVNSLIREIGDQKYYEFGDIPLFWFRLSVTFNPAVVESWTFPGTGAAKTSHWDLLKAAR